MAEPAHYQLGEPWEFTSTFKVNGVATDPTAVTATIVPPSPAAETTLTFPDANLTKDSVGVYRVKGTANLVGTWYVIVTGTGAAAAVERHEFVVDARLPKDLLNADALTTAEKAEAWLARHNIQLTGEADDDLVIAILVNGASAAVQNELDRKLKPAETGVAKKFRYDGTGYLDLAPFELGSWTSVVLYTDLPTAAQWTLAAQSGTAEADYRFEPRQKNLLGTYDRVFLPRISRNALPNGEHEVTVTGNWGVATVPGDIEWLVLEIVRLSYPETISVRSPDLEIGGLGLQWLPRQLMDILERYRRT